MTDLREPVTAPAPAPEPAPAPPPRRWLPRRRGWGRAATAAGSLLAIGTVIVVVLWQMHFSLLLSDTTTTGGDTVRVELRDAPATASVLSETVLHYVLRTRESVILDDAATQSPFADDPYIRERKAH